ncbi:MAG: leucine-rich repeat protein [Alphaproteobacteria bacterium]|nr:leucine-rich repeat protein [Alphaproteobacteria bacterium]
MTLQKPFCSFIKSVIFAIFVVFTANSAFAACASNQIDVNGGGSVCEPVKFTVNLKNNTTTRTTFDFEISAKGTFYVDCGNAGTLDGPSVSGSTVSGKTITRTINTSTLYTCSWNSWAQNDTQTVRFSGNASDTTSSYGTYGNPTIRFYSGADTTEKATNARLITGVSGKLSDLFPRASNTTTAQPRFYQTFHSAENLEAIQDDLFYGYTVATTHMFQQTFRGCTSLESIPEGLFSGISGAADYMFQQTFYGCTSLESIPKGLFSGISGSANYMFQQTFYNCSSLTGITKGQTSTSYVPGTFLNGVTEGGTNVVYQMFTRTGLESPCPSGTDATTPSWAATAGKPWCSPTYAITYNMNGGTNYSNAPTTYTEGIGTTISGTPTHPNDHFFLGWTGNGVTIPSSSITIGPSDTGAKTITANWAELKFTLTTSSTDSFQFNLSAKGTFYVDCGNGGTLNGTGVSGSTITRADTTEATYTCSWDSSAVQTIKFGGSATNTTTTYSSDTSTPAISFYAGSSDDAKLANAEKIASVSGNLSAMFPYITGNAQSGAQPRFYETLAWARYLTSVPATLFDDYTTPATYMFYGTFRDTGLTTVPAELFSGITGAADYLFAFVFEGCSSLTSIPLNMFTGISGAANSMFESAFYGSNLTSITDGGTSTTYIPGSFLSGVTGGTNVARYMFSMAELAGTCPSGTVTTTPSWATDASKPWCSPGNTITYNLNGGTNYSGAPTTYVYGVGTTISGTPTKSGYIFKGWTGSNGSTPQPTVTIGASATGAKSYTANWELPKFTLTTTSTNSYQFSMTAIGTFYVDCGNGGTLSGTGVSGTTITRSNTTEVTYTCTWNSSAFQTILFGGEATGYSASSESAINFYKFSTPNAAKIASVSGNLSAIFPYVSGNAQDGAQPRFASAFGYATNLTSVPDTLFANYTTAASYMFDNTFGGSGLTTIPAGLFNRISSAGEGAFIDTFYGCTSLTSIPADSFSGMSGSGDYVFLETFYGCTNLASITDGQTSTTYVPGTFLTTVTGGEGVVSDMFANTSLASSCPAGTYTVTPSWASDAGKPWCATVVATCVAGEYLNASNAQCTACPAGKYCAGGTYTYNGTDLGITGDVTAGYFASGGAKVAAPTSSSDCLSGNTCGQCTSDSTTGRKTYSTAGAASCSVCPAVTGDIASRVTSYSGWWSNDIHNKITGCAANFSDTDNDATFRVYCYYNTTDGAYGGANSICEVRHPTACAAGKYDTITSTDEWNWTSNPTYARGYGIDFMNGKVCTNTDAGYYSAEDSLTQTACAAGTYSTGGAASCTVCDGSTYSSTTGATSCTACPRGYTIGSTSTIGEGTVKPIGKIDIDVDEATDHDDISDCKITCSAGYAVLTANARACETIQNSTYKGKYTTLHSVSYGSTSTINDCPRDYDAANGTTAQSNCQTACDAGTAVHRTNDQCTAITTDNKYTTRHNINYGQTSILSTCNTTNGYTNSGTTAADHAGQSSCKTTITLNKNGGSGTIQGTSGTGNASIICSQSVSCDFGGVSGLTKTGYTFSGGWGTSADCTATTTSFTNPTGTYYACESPNQINITWDGVTSQEALATNVRQVYYDGDIHTPQESNLVSKTGASFQGWKFKK